MRSAGDHRDRESPRQRKAPCREAGVRSVRTSEGVVPIAKPDVRSYFGSMSTIATSLELVSGTLIGLEFLVPTGWYTKTEHGIQRITVLVGPLQRHPFRSSSVLAVIGVFGLLAWVLYEIGTGAVDVTVLGLSSALITGALVGNGTAYVINRRFRNLRNIVWRSVAQVAVHLVLVLVSIGLLAGLGMPFYSRSRLP